MPLGLLPGVTLSISQEKLPESIEILFGESFNISLPVVQLDPALCTASACVICCWLVDTIQIFPKGDLALRNFRADEIRSSQGPCLADSKRHAVLHPGACCSAGRQVWWICSQGARLDWFRWGGREGTCTAACFVLEDHCSKQRLGLSGKKKWEWAHDLEALDPVIRTSQKQMTGVWYWDTKDHTGKEKHRKALRKPYSLLRSRAWIRSGFLHLMGLLLHTEEIEIYLAKRMSEPAIEHQQLDLSHPGSTVAVGSQEGWLVFITYFLLMYIRLFSTAH